MKLSVPELPELGAAYEANVGGHFMVLWCLFVHESSFSTNYEFIILEGRNDSGNLFRSWSMPKLRPYEIYVSEVWPTFTILDAMRQFQFKRIA